MFKKPPQLKPASPLRSSSRRSFLAHLQTLYPALADAPPELLSQLVPNGLRHGGATTSGGQKAVIYTNESGKPLWFELGPQAGSALQQSEKNNKKGSGGSVGDDKDKLFEVFPTIYALWIAPDVLPRLPTWPQIVDPTLLSGSALMIPGCIPQPHTFPPHLQHASSSSSLPPKSATIAITPYPSPVPLVVARLDADMQDIVQRRASGEKGKAATTIHAYGDFLWELGGKGEPPKPEAHLRDSSFNNTNDLHGTEKASQGSKVVEKEADATINFAEDNDEEGLEHATNASTFAVQEVDSILNLALLYTLVKLSKRTQQFPMSLSSFYSSHVLPNRPAHWPPLDVKGKRKARLPYSLFQYSDEEEEKGERCVVADHTDVRHSSAKKLAKWIKAMEKRDLVKCKDVKGKDTMIVSISSKHADLEGIVPYLTLSERQAVHEADLGSAGCASASTKGATSANGANTNHAASSDANAKTQVVVERFWKANASSVKLFQEMDASTSEPLSRPTIRQFLNSYITTRCLVDAADQSQIKVDDAVLTHALFPKASLSEIPPRMRREAMLDKLLATSCVEYHRLSRLRPDRAREMLLNNTKSSSPTTSTSALELETGEEVGPMTKGAHKRLQLDIKPRQGRKVVSLLTGLEQYGVDAEVFAADLMRTVGASASAQILQPATAKVKARYEVFVQGDQRKVILEFMTREGIDKSFVNLVDHTKK